ncbi:MAG: hypothetical protein QM791_23160 [Ferruginibacter sp.]
MKKLLLLPVVILVCTGVFAQARLATASYQKAMQPAVEHDFPFAEKTVSKAIEDRMQKAGYKGKETKGFVVYKGVHMKEIGPDTYDLYFKVDKKDKEKSLVTMMISSGYEKFIGESDNSTVIENSKQFLDHLIHVSEAFDLEQQIVEQDVVSKKSSKKLADLVEDGEDLQKKKAKLEKEIEENLKKQEDQKKDIETQTQILETLKSKRKQ